MLLPIRDWVDVFLLRMHSRVSDGKDTRYGITVKKRSINTIIALGYLMFIKIHRVLFHTVDFAYPWGYSMIKPFLGGVKSCSLLQKLKKSRGRN